MLLHRGWLVTPLLVLLFNMNPITAVGTDLLYAAVTKILVTLVHGSNQTADGRCLIQVPSVPGGRSPPPQAFGKFGAKLVAPVRNALVRDQPAAFGQGQFDITQG
jgi:hypothetical protein